MILSIESSCDDSCHYRDTKNELSSFFYANTLFSSAESPRIDKPCLGTLL